MTLAPRPSPPGTGGPMSRIERPLDAERLSEDVQAAFWSRVEKRSPNECWPWHGSFDRQGRGKFWVAGTGKHHRAPRISLIIRTGEFPPKATFACHTCDNPACVNPDHLWWGTRSENMKDCGAKGRHPAQTKFYGSANHNTALTENDVRKIRAQYHAGVPPRVLAEQYGTISSNIWKIATGRSWRHVT